MPHFTKLVREGQFVKFHKLKKRVITELVTEDGPMAETVIV